MRRHAYATCFHYACHACFRRHAMSLRCRCRAYYDVILIRCYFHAAERATLFFSLLCHFSPYTYAFMPLR